MPTVTKAMSVSGKEIPKKSTREFKTVAIRREGEQILLPDGMSYAEGRTWLSRQEEAEEKTVAFNYELECYPLDGIISMMWALKERYGFAELQDTPSFFGPQPPNLVQVELANGQFETAPMGRIATPKWEGGHMDLLVGREAKLFVRGVVKRKTEDEIKEIIAFARDMLKEKSIYKGQAITVDLSWMDEEHDFHPTNDAPKFMHVEGMDENSMILNPTTEFELKANVFTLIEQTEACRRNKIPLKHGCLLMGPFGTGKTLCAKVTASKCVRHGWTFVYLKKCQHLAHALRMAQLYAPAVIFTEDIDQVVTGDRDAALNEILNTIDGVDTKDKPIITILTTNNALKIEPAFMRAGRIDTVVEMDAPDAVTAIRFIHLYAKGEDGRTLLAQGQDLTEAGKAMEGFVPAFIAESVQKAKRFAIHREGPEIMGKLTGEDLVLAGKALRKHMEMVNRKPSASEQELVAEAVARVNNYRNGSEDQLVKNVKHIKQKIDDNF